VTAAAALITTHKTVAILSAGDFTSRVGERFGISKYKKPT